MSTSGKTALAVVPKAENIGPTLVEIARTYIARQWNPVPVRYRQKKPIGNDWQLRTITMENVTHYFSVGQRNIGMQLGPKSKGLADVDLDCDEAVRLAHYFLPPTGSVFGRASKSKSHFLYYVNDAPSKPTIKHTDAVGKDGRCIVELRLGGGKKGAQTVFPGSTHESGELIKWATDDEPSQVSFAALDRVVRSIAVAALLLRHWPDKKGSRHDFALCVGGFLARCGYNEEDISRLVEIVACAAADDEVKDRTKAATDSAVAFVRGEPAWGLRKLREFVGPQAANAMAKIIKYGKVVETVGSKGVLLEDFNAYMPMHNYIFAPSREPWPASSVNARLGSVPLFDADGEPVLNDKGEQVEMAASAWLDRNRPVEQMTWAPGLPMLIRDRLISDGGWIERPKVTCLNLYRPPTIKPGNAAEAGRWREHIVKVFGEEDTDHIVKFLAHRVQKPQEKINHALVLGGAQGIGKDTILEPAKHAVGPWNFFEVSPHHMLGRFNGFLKSVILRVSEARDLGDVNRYQFYDHMKSYTAAPPDVLRVDEKHLREHNILNCCGVIITTNHKADGIYLPADDRRHFVAWSDLTKEEFADDYWNKLWAWYAKGGVHNVAAYLAKLDLSAFDAKAPPKKTAAFWAIVDANRAPEDSELADIIDQLGNPDAVTLAMISAASSGCFFEWLNDRKNRRAIPHRFEQCGFVPVRNEAATDGYYVIGGRRQAVYAKANLSISERFKAAGELASRKWVK